MADTQEEKEWLSKVMKVIHDGLVVFQDEFIAETNSAFAEMLDHDKKDLLDMPFDELVDSRSLEQDKKMLDALFKAKGCSKFNTRLKSKNGDIVHVEITPAEFEWEGGPAVIAAIRDISRQVALESQVTELENRFATLYDMSPNAYFTLNRSGMIEQVNAAAEELLGCTADEIIGQPLAEFFPKPDAKYDPGRDIIREVTRGKNVRGLEVEMKRKDDRLIWVSLSSRALVSAENGESEIGLMALDITRRKNTEQRLIKESERADLYFELMASDLNVIYQSTLFALEDLRTFLDLPPRQKEVVEETMWNIRRAARIIANMGVLLGESPTKQQTKLNAHVRKAITEADREFEWKTLKVKSNLDEQTYDVEGHPMLWNVFFNIIQNSMMYDERDTVKIRVRAKTIESGKFLRLEFSDWGPGIPDELKKQLFQRRATPEMRGMVKGLGLTVADWFLSSLGGRIWVEDRVKGSPEKGSKFILVLPIWEEAVILPPIVFYKSDHCVFCGPVLDSLQGVLDELGLGRSLIQLINIDDPDSGVKEADLPALPTINIGEEQLTGFVTEDDLRSRVMHMLLSAR
jgi:PAS domain S-box-containing protein